jgi:CheY-like chemotaxis protein
VSAASVILLVEDNDDDVFFMERAMTKAQLNHPLHVARDGQEAIDYLAGEGKFSDRGLYPLPSVVFLDLKLPYIHGFDVLTWIRQQEEFRQLPVVILTSSPEERDQQKAESLGAQAYLVKPPNAEMILQTFRGLKAGGPAPTAST